MAEGGRAPRVTVLLPSLAGGGAERMHLEMARVWIARGVQVEFALLQPHGPLLEALPPGATWTDLDAPRFRHGFRPIARHLRAHRPDALLAALWPLTAVAALAARAAGFRGRVVVSDHSPLSLAYAGHGRWHRRLLRASLRVAYPLADERVAVSEGVARDLAALSGLPLGRIRVIHNPAARGVTPAAPCPPELAGLRGPLVLSVGTLRAAKDQDLLLRAFARLPAELGATLCVLGEGPLRDPLERRVAELGLAERVVLPGFRADPSPWYQRADVFALSSRYEGFGNVLVEALEHGLPIVSTDCEVGPREVLRAGRFGTLVPVGDAAALADGIAAALHEPRDPEPLRARAREFEVGPIAERYLALLLPGHPAPPEEAS